MLTAMEKNDYRMELSVKFTSTFLHKSGVVKHLIGGFSHLTIHVAHDEAALKKISDRMMAGIDQLVESVAATYYASTITNEDLESFINLLKSDIGSKFTTTVIGSSGRIQPIISNWAKDVETMISHIVYIHIPHNYNHFVPKLGSNINMEDVYGITRLLPC